MEAEKVLEIIIKISGNVEIVLKRLSLLEARVAELEKEFLNFINEQK